MLSLKVSYALVSCYVFDISGIGILISRFHTYFPKHSKILALTKYIQREKLDMKGTCFKFGNFVKNKKRKTRSHLYHPEHTKTL